MLTPKNKGQVSIEFLLSLLILIIIISAFININTKIKTKLETSINYNEYNLKVCVLKQAKLIEENGVINYDSCKKEESSSYGS